MLLGKVMWCDESDTSSGQFDLYSPAGCAPSLLVFCHSDLKQVALPSLLSSSSSTRACIGRLSPWSQRLVYQQESKQDSLERFSALPVLPVLPVLCHIWVPHDIFKLSNFSCLTSKLLIWKPFTNAFYCNQWLITPIHRAASICTAQLLTFEKRRFEMAPPCLVSNSSF